MWDPIIVGFNIKHWKLSLVPHYCSPGNLWVGLWKTKKSFGNLLFELYCLNLFQLSTNSKSFFCRFQTLSNMNLVKNSIRTFLHIQTCLINPKHFNFLNLEPGRLKFDAWNILPRVLNRNGWRLFTWLATSPEPYQLWHVWPSQKLRFRLSAINIKFETFKWWWYKDFNWKMWGKYLPKSSYLID